MTSTAATSAIQVRDLLWTTLRFAAMGCPVELQLQGDPALGSWARDEIERLEQCWSRFRADSELSRLNRSTATVTEVSPTLLLALQCAQQAWTLTQGAFDPTILATLCHLGYDRSFPQVAKDGPPLAGDAPQVPGMHHVAVVPATRQVHRPAGVAIDLGGIGKGLAADLVVEHLVERGARSVCLSMGGDIRVGGLPPTEQGWRIPVENPAHDGEVAFTHPLTAGAIVTSTTQFRSWKRGGRRLHHIIDPVTGSSAESNVAGAVVAADKAWLAEVLAKTAIVTGVEMGASLCERLGTKAWFFAADGREVDNPGLERIEQLTGSSGPVLSPVAPDWSPGTDADNFCALGTEEP